ncbi:MTH1187 family thiamine-binding protein [Halomonas sp. THAF12]|uniref:MTH1187 family thiamine-binding protein n=1 Tax=Halomonas sp. B23F22_10 TaxID=3459515 RepID=UPI00373F91A0
MKVIVDLCVVPMGVGVSVSPHVAACQEVIEASGLEYRMHAYGTNIEGPWDEVMAVVKRCHERVHQMGAPRITSTLKLGTRTDREQGMDDKVASVEALLGGQSSPKVS